MALDISLLPEEVLVHIFQCLNFKSKLTVARVCKKWFHATNCRKYLCDIKIKISKDIDEAVKVFSDTTRRFECFAFHDVTIGDSTVEFLKKYSSQFVMLSFTDCNIAQCKTSSRNKILHCNNLKTLDVENTDIISWFASFSNISTLKLNLGPNLTDYVISVLIPSLYKLEVLSLKGESPCEETVREDFNINEAIQNPSQTTLSFSIIKILIKNNRTTLKSIDFSELCLTSAPLLAISEMEGLKLRSVGFPSNLDSEYIATFCRNQFSLTSLDLSSIVPKIDGVVQDVCRCLPSLQELTIHHSIRLRKAIKDIFQLQHLVKLDLSECTGISEARFRRAVYNLNTFKLKHLNLASTKISDESLYNLLKGNPNIRYLNLTRTEISDKTLNMISQNLILLERLILDSCDTISDSGLTGEIENAPGNSIPTPLSNLKYLRELNLHQNPLITTDGCLNSIRFRNLETLNLRGCDCVILGSGFEIRLTGQNPGLLSLYV